MLTTGNQLQAAPALVDMDQATLAGRAGVNINTIGSMEKRGAGVLTSGYDKIRSVMGAVSWQHPSWLPKSRLNDNPKQT